jgi:hypothetical protein
VINEAFLGVGRNQDERDPGAIAKEIDRLDVT